MQSIRRTLVEFKAKRSPQYSVSHSDDPNAITNVRALRMLEECLTFLPHMDQYAREMPGMSRATSEFMDSIHLAMGAPLPRVWEHVDGGLAEPIRATISHEYPHTAGGEIDQMGLRETALELEKRLSDDILAAMGQWKEALMLVEVINDLSMGLDRAGSVVGALQDRMPELERLRRDAERRRQSALKAEHRTRGYRTPMERGQRRWGFAGLMRKIIHPATSEVAPVAPETETAEEFRNEEVNMQVNHKQRKYQAARQSYQEQESLVFTQLSGLCRDAAWLKSYMVASLIMMKEAFQKGVVLLGPTKQPLPIYGFAEHQGMEHGAVADNYDAAAMVPAFLQHYQPAKQETGALGRLLTDASRPSKGTAQPLELHAREDISGTDMVPEVLRGASDMPAGGKGAGRMTGSGGRAGGWGGMGNLGMEEALGSARMGTVGGH